MSRAAACATTPAAQKAADRALADGGSAADAVVSGFFALAGESAASLFAPTTILLAGPGVSARAIDGRAAQPGAGAKRPRGIVEDAAVPLAARAAVPRAAQAVLLLQGTQARRSLKKNVAAGVAAAKASGALRRAAFLSRIGDGGPVALAAANEAILRAAGRYAGGLLTEEDLATARPGDRPAELFEATASTGESMRVHLEPWAASAPEDEGEETHDAADIVAAVDGRGLSIALACFSPAGAREGAHLVPEIEVALPLVAEPVRRAKTRVAPGTVFAVPRTIAAVDCGPDLRLVVGAPRGLSSDGAVAAFGARPIEEGLRSLGAASPLWAVVATARDAQAVAFGGPA
jgi:gamma-glutamyltranspeptidase/glutathione hydrolase